MSLAFDASRRSVDPTGTSKLRGKFRSDLQLRLRMLRAQLRVAVVEHDVLALGRGGIMSFHPPDVRLRAFTHWLEVAIASLVAGHWVREYIMRASEAGVAAAVKELGLGTAAARQASNDLLEEQTVNEIAGIGDAVIQQITRAATAVIQRNMKAPKAYALLAATFDKVALPRTKALADTAVVTAFNHAKLDIYEANGIKEVGIDPEIHPGTVRTHSSDAATGHNRPPVKQRRSRWKAEAVGVRTAADEKVCQTCEDIAEDGPYTTDEARELIPAHPHCRCSVYRYYDKRFRRDSSLAGGLSRS
jgi:hypothetical protein